MTTEAAKHQVELFKESVHKMYAEVESWIAGTELRAERTPIELNEEDSGKYAIDQLVLKTADGKIIARFRPEAAFVLSGKGRIDIIGTVDRIILLDLEEGGPTYKTLVLVGDRMEERTIPFYRGAGRSGWHWIDERGDGNAHFLSKGIFFEILEHISDYGIK